jgi:hypothetical protein
MELPAFVVGASTMLVAFTFGVLVGSLLTRRRMRRGRVDFIPGVPRADFEEELSAAMSRAASGQNPAFTETLGRQSVRRFVHLARHPHNFDSR